VESPEKFKRIVVFNFNRLRHQKEAPKCALRLGPVGTGCIGFRYPTLLVRLLGLDMRREIGYSNGENFREIQFSGSIGQKWSRAEPCSENEALVWFPGHWNVTFEVH